MTDGGADIIEFSVIDGIAGADFRGEHIFDFGGDFGLLIVFGNLDADQYVLRRAGILQGDFAETLAA